MTETTTGSPPAPALCGHEFSYGGVAYKCERAPHPIDGNGPPCRHASPIDAELARRLGEDDDEDRGEADLLTWGEDDTGDGQEVEAAWGTVADYGQPPAPADMFGGHEFAYESGSDLFRCARCRAYEVTARGDDGEISQCPGDVPGEPMVLNAF